MQSLKNYLLIPGLLLFNFLMAQNYQAINGSMYAGSLAPGNNPASIVHVPYAWDITPFSVQAKQCTNAFKIKNYSLLSSPQNATVTGQNGIKKRFVFANQDIRLLNTRIKLGEKAALAFGANIRNYVYATSSESNWQDTVVSLADFMKINIDRLALAGESKGSTWVELYGTYARTIIDDGDRVLNAGLTVKVNRAIAGAYASAQGLSYIPAPVANDPGYLLSTGNFRFGYSSNFDNIDSNKTAAANRKIFLQKTYSSLSADIGLQYILIPGESKEEGDDYTYQSKIGISIIDIGKNKYRLGRSSSLATAGLPGITDTLLEDKFSGVGSVDNFKDSLASIAGSFTKLKGDFYIYQPTRLIINVDQHVVNSFYVNAELTLPLLPLVQKDLRYIKDMNLLAITPRWETRSWGVYLPVLLNTRNQVWVGGALKAGPVLLGTHNLANLFSKNTLQTGGFYLAFTIRPGKDHDRQSRFQDDKRSGKAKRSLECPKF